MTRLSSTLEATIRSIPDWPAPGVMFRDLTPVFAEARVFGAVIAHLADRYRPVTGLMVAGIDARGFIIGAALAHALGAGFVPLRKAGKLPGDTYREPYVLEYGEAVLEIHVDAMPSGTPVVLIDDLIATGGTLLAATALIHRLGGVLHEVAALVDLPDLGGSRRLIAAGHPPYTLVTYSGA